MSSQTELRLRHWHDDSEESTRGGWWTIGRVNIIKMPDPVELKQLILQTELGKFLRELGRCGICFASMKLWSGSTAKQRGEFERLLATELGLV